MCCAIATCWMALFRGADAVNLNVHAGCFLCMRTNLVERIDTEASCAPRSVSLSPMLRLHDAKQTCKCKLLVAVHTR